MQKTGTEGIQDKELLDRKSNPLGIVQKIEI